jgi:hypothetical protein
MTTRCETCRFYDPIQGVTLGFCRRYAPTSSNMSADSYFPTVSGKDDWCGEHASQPVTIDDLAARAIQKATVT